MYGNRKTYRKTYKKATGKGKAKPKRKVYAKMQNKTVRSIVKKEIARNVENKITANDAVEQSILSVLSNPSGGGVNTLTYVVINPVANGLLNMTQGVDVVSRIGNKIKLKRFVIKGTVYYDPQATPSIAFPQSQGYVDVYFGRLLNMAGTISSQLPNFYQNGNTSTAPYCALIERCSRVNKDLYKIYWHKRFKIGNTGTSTISNNDYSLNREFGLDVCKLVCKNKIVKYEDNTPTPNDALLHSLCLFATFSMPNENMPLTGLANSTTYYSPVKIAVNSYCEYEDA